MCCAEIEKIEQRCVPGLVPSGGNDLVRKRAEKAKEFGFARYGDLFSRREIGFRIFFPARIGTDADEPPARLERVVDRRERGYDDSPVAPDERQHVLREHVCEDATRLLTDIASRIH